MMKEGDPGSYTIFVEMRISICLEMAEEWRQVVKNLESQYHLIFMGYLYCNIEIDQIELEICSWLHLIENSWLFNLLMDIE